MQATLLYTQTARPLKNRHAWALADEAKADGVVRRIKKVPLHGKFVTWDDDDLVVTSSDWASASADPDFAWGEIGVHIHAMRVFVSGATGVLGRQLLPKLVAAGQSVWGMTCYSAKADLIGAAGATPVIADALDRDAVIPAIANAAPEVIVHELTALSSFANLQIRSGARPDQPLTHQGDALFVGWGSQGGCTALRGTELRRVAVCARGWTGQNRRGSA